MSYATATTRHRKAAAEEFQYFAETARAPRLRTMAEFAEDEIVIPTGDYAGQRYRLHRQPVNRLWFAEIDAGRWHTHVMTGPSQGSKTLTGFHAPWLYYIFERRETVIVGIPDMDLAADKWNRDMLPMIEATRFRELLPRRGGGSRGGTRIDLISFRNGASLKFMSGGGGDKARAHFTARVLIISETDGLDTVGSNSREADKIRQMVARTRHYGDRAVVFMECTVSTPEGRTWRELQAGSDSRVAMLCPHCRAYVHCEPEKEREHVRGWENADDEIAAREASHWVCPGCAQPWTEDQRIRANEGAVLIHRGQTAAMVRGRCVIEGEPPRTRTLGFRFGAVNNLFVTAASVGASLWKAQRDPDEDNAEKELCQFIFAVPHKPSKVEATPLDPDALNRRTTKHPRGLVPDDAELLTAHVDVHKYLLYYAVVGWKMDSTGYVVDYGVIDVHSKELGLEKATVTALAEWRDLCEAGWARSGEQPKKLDTCWIDIGWAESRPQVLAFCREDKTHRKIVPVLGRGVGQRYARSYAKPSKRGEAIQHIGLEYHFRGDRKEQLYVAEVNADFWKSRVHESLSSPAGQPGALLLFHAPGNEHFKFIKHLTAERQVDDVIVRKGSLIQVKRWEQVRRQNHWFDNVYNCAAAAHWCGARWIAEPKRIVKVEQPTLPGLTLPDGSPFLVTERR